MDRMGEVSDVGTREVSDVSTRESLAIMDRMLTNAVLMTETAFIVQSRAKTDGKTISKLRVASAQAIKRAKALDSTDRDILVSADKLANAARKSMTLDDHLPNSLKVHCETLLRVIAKELSVGRVDDVQTSWPTAEPGDLTTRINGLQYRLRHQAQPRGQPQGQPQGQPWSVSMNGNKANLDEKYPLSSPDASVIGFSTEMALPAVPEDGAGTQARWKKNPSKAT